MSENKINFNKFKSNNKNPFQVRNNIRNKAAQEWGQVKFVPKVPKFRPERVQANAATPWKSFKDELVEKQREESTSNNLDMNSDEAKQILKKREANYRRMLITEHAKQPTSWETFEDNTAESSQKKSTDLTKTLLKGVDLQNFDSKKLNFKQNNTIRKILTLGITKTTSNLKSEVFNLKKKNLKKRKK